MSINGSIGNICLLNKLSLSVLAIVVALLNTYIVELLFVYIIGVCMYC